MGMEIERMNTLPDERNTNSPNPPPNQSNEEIYTAVLTLAQGLLKTSERNQKAAESNHKEIQSLLDILNKTNNALSAKWETQIETQNKALARQTQTITEAAQSVSASADSGARNGVNQAIAAVKRQALEAFNLALKPNLSELNQAVQNIEEARKGFKNAARYLTWKAVGLYTLVAVLPLLALLGWDRHLVQKIESERATINTLDANGGRMKLSHCGDDRRLCVQVDSKSGYFGDKNDYWIIKGN
jgi:DNA-binding transcriptional MerR regulator